VALETINY